MMRFSTFVILLFIGWIGWSLYGNELADGHYQAAFENMKSDINVVKDRPEVASAIDTLQNGFDSLIGELNQALGHTSKDEFPLKPTVEKPNLKEPINHSISVNNIELGDSKKDVEQIAGKAKRSSYNEYGTKWYTYHKDYQNFFMVTYDQHEKVAGLYTNQDLISSKQGFKLGSTKDVVLKELGKPETNIRKGFVIYQFQNDGESNLFQLDDSYVTVFYDKHEKNTVTAIQLISRDLEQQKKSFYTDESHKLEQGFEYQLFDLTNAARVEHGLRPLTWDKGVKETALDHSIDMAKHNYFNHTDLEGKSPFDRMNDDGITFRAAGENLATGQLSSIFAHEGLMNSLGHRKNILQPDFTSLGVGVAFDSESKPYYTENFLLR